MTQMQEGEQEEAKKPEHSWVLWTIKHIFIVMGVSIVLAIAGVVLGAINYMGGPVHYDVWILAAWMVVDVLLLVLLLLHLVLYSIIINDSPADDGLIGVCIIVGLILLIVGGIMLSVKHLAYVSICELLLLVAATVIDILIVIQQA